MLPSLPKGKTEGTEGNRKLLVLQLSASHEARAGTTGIKPGGQRLLALHFAGGTPLSKRHMGEEAGVGTCHYGAEHLTLKNPIKKQHIGKNLPTKPGTKLPSQKLLLGKEQ